MFTVKIRFSYSDKVVQERFYGESVNIVNLWLYIMKLFHAVKQMTFCALKCKMSRNNLVNMAIFLILNYCLICYVAC